MRNQIQDALSQVKELRTRIFDNRQFEGYSGIARGCGAVAALAGMLILRTAFVPKTVSAHVAGWGAICALGICCNYGALASWYLSRPPQTRTFSILRPVFDAVPALLIGGVLTWTMLLNGVQAQLPGIWMMQFGLMHTSSRHALPAAIWWLGWYYIACGVWYLLIFTQPDFTDPVPMGCVFVVGETAGAVIFHLHRKSLQQREGV